MLPSFCRDTVTRLRAQITFSRGSEVYDWSDPDELEITGCSMQPASTSISTDGRVLAILDEYTLFAPADADIKPEDHIEFNGKEYEIAGDVRMQPAAQRLEHLEIRLRRYEG